MKYIIRLSVSTAVLFIAVYLLLMQYRYDDFALILFFIAILDLAHVYQKDDIND